ncbi:MAG: TorF family putative porin [Steroidobacteraceae bacterium]
MKHVKILSALGLLAVAGAANAEISGSAAIASSYHWRGFDLGSGTPAVSGELKYSAGGFYVAGWVSSGDTTAGTEYDLYAGYGGEVGDFNYDISYITYVYPTGDFKNVEEPGDFAEVIGKVGYGPVKVFLNYNVAGASKSDYINGVSRYAFPRGDYMYYGISATFGQFSAVLAKHDEKVWNGVNDFVSATKAAPGVTGDATHLDLTYAYNDNLSFTVSGILDSKLGDAEPKPKLVVAYSVPFGK